MQRQCSDRSRPFEFDVQSGRRQLSICDHDATDPTNADFSNALNKALGEAHGDKGAHGGLTPPTHRVGFHVSLHHDNDALHVDHFNGAKFPIGTLLHAIVDLILACCERSDVTTVFSKEYVA